MTRQCLTLIWWMMDTAPLVGCTKSAQVTSWHYNSIQTTTIKEEQINNTVTVGDFEQSNLSFWRFKSFLEWSKLWWHYWNNRHIWRDSSNSIGIPANHCGPLFCDNTPITKYVITYRKYKLTDLETLRSHLFTDHQTCWWHGKPFQCCWHGGTNGKTWSSVYKTSGDMAKKCFVEHW